MITDRLTLMDVMNPTEPNWWDKFRPSMTALTGHLARGGWAWEAEPRSEKPTLLMLAMLGCKVGHETRKSVPDLTDDELWEQTLLVWPNYRETPEANWLLRTFLQLPL